MRKLLNLAVNLHEKEIARASRVNKQIISAQTYNFRLRALFTSLLMFLFDDAHVMHQIIIASINRSRENTLFSSFALLICSLPGLWYWKSMGCEIWHLIENDFHLPQ